MASPDNPNERDLPNRHPSQVIRHALIRLATLPLRAWLRCNGTPHKILGIKRAACKYKTGNSQCAGHHGYNHKFERKISGRRPTQDYVAH